ncbi:MAG: hypothetical protein R2825_10750 [Saprospiraceae bacterium]
MNKHPYPIKSKQGLLLFQIGHGYICPPRPAPDTPKMISEPILEENKEAPTTNHPCFSCQKIIDRLRRVF